MVNIRSLFTLMTFALSHSASAVCLDPVTFSPGFHVQLVEEVRLTQFIVIGKVISCKVLQEDVSDPRGVTAYLWHLKVIRELKGRSSRNIIIRVENDSARYPLAVGEEHLLFLSRKDKYFSVNSCGNSSSILKERSMLRQVEVELAASL